MLDYALRWAGSHSIDHPSAFPGGGTFPAASEARGQSAPSLVLRSGLSASPAKAPSSHDLPGVLAALMSELQQIASSNPVESSPQASFEALDRTQRAFNSLPLPTQQFVNVLLHLGQGMVEKSSTIDVKT